jgi:hypothetical protein
LFRVSRYTRVMSGALAIPIIFGFIFSVLFVAYWWEKREPEEPRRMDKPPRRMDHD